MKRHFNAAPLYSDRRIVERAKELEHLHADYAARELGVGYRRLKRLSIEYGLTFAGSDRAMRPLTQPKTNADVLDHFMVAKIDGVKYKKCTRCMQVKTIESFHRDKSKSTGSASACKSCLSRRQDIILDGDTK